MGEQRQVGVGVRGSAKKSDTVSKGPYNAMPARTRSASSTWAVDKPPVPAMNQPKPGRPLRAPSHQPVRQQSTSNNEYNIGSPIAQASARVAGPKTGMPSQLKSKMFHDSNDGARPTHLTSHNNGVGLWVHQTASRDNLPPIQRNGSVKSTP